MTIYEIIFSSNLIYSSGILLQQANSWKNTGCVLLFKPLFCWLALTSNYYKRAVKKMLFKSTSIKIFPYFLIIMLVARHSEMKFSDRSPKLPEPFKEIGVHLEPNFNCQKKESIDSLGILSHERLVRRAAREETCSLCAQAIEPYTGPPSPIGCNHRFHVECLETIKVKECPICKTRPENWIHRNNELRLEEQARRVQPEDSYCSKTVVLFWVIAFIPPLLARIYS
ncbi:hypothetical protein PGT21_006912 [Puccinia graminis f. sp. tritici]|uniref:RING-type domain-containing protein n=3 Tax=Puccinia graminis f. sp. tritici TaxID=56615 RepID=A0A5B0QZW0_PUCGR|nr:hypothetical protein PGT21_006912 [Puccinia graminis f. sp. tritici]